jgi:Fe-S-cluster containining protein
MIEVVARCLSFHAAYRCRHSGACCTATWSIPFDREEATRVEELTLTGSGGLVWKSGNDDLAFARKMPDGTCGFFDRDSHLCAIHRAGGSTALPATCRMFPRLVLHDARGTFVSLSHFCPTAAAMLFDAPGPDAIVDAPASLTGEGRLEGLDATDAWAPLLRTSVLMDLDAYAAWEERAVDLLTSSGVPPWQALHRLDHATRLIARWTPGEDDRSLRRCVDDAFERTVQASDADALPDGALFFVVAGAVPPPFVAPPASEGLAQGLTAARDAVARHSHAVNRWLASRLFGTWIAYQASSLTAIVRVLRAALDTLVMELTRAADQPIDRQAMLEAVRRSDYLIVHLANSQRLASRLSDPCLSSTAS